MPCVRPSDVYHAAGRRKTSRDRGTGRSFRIRHTDALQPMVVSLCCLFSLAQRVAPSGQRVHGDGPVCAIQVFETSSWTSSDTQCRTQPPPVPKSRVCPGPPHLSSPVRIHVARSVSRFHSTCQTTVLHSLACSSASQLADPVGSSPPDRCGPLVNTVDLTALSTGSGWDEVYDRVNRRSGRG